MIRKYSRSFFAISGEFRYRSGFSIVHEHRRIPIMHYPSLLSIAVVAVGRASVSSEEPGFWGSPDGWSNEVHRNLAERCCYQSGSRARIIRSLHGALRISISGLRFFTLPSSFFGFLSLCTRLSSDPPSRAHCLFFSETPPLRFFRPYVRSSSTHLESVAISLSLMAANRGATSR